MTSSCPVCNSRNCAPHQSLQGHLFYRCRDCLLVFLNTDKALQKGRKVYTSEYIQARGLESAESPVTKSKEATARHYFSFVEKQIPVGEVLDIGCSTGATLTVAQQRGWEIFGTDVNEAAVSVARDRLQVNTIEAGHLTEDIFKGKSFSLCLMFDVLEHMHEPLKYMQVINKKLKSNGLLLLITPNIHSLSARILKNKWPHFLLEHVCLYAPQSIRNFLSRCQFKVLKIGWAIKFVNVDMLKHHLECHPHIFLSNPARAVLDGADRFKNKTFPLNLGEMYVLAQKS